MDSESPIEKRLFLGIAAPAGILGPVRELREAMEGTPGIRWIKDENLHITVFFFGNVSETVMPNLIEMIRVTLRHFQPFELIFDQFTLAPKPQRPRMIWARYYKAETFRLLVNRITDLYEQIHPEQQQRRSPTPHITVARLRGAGVGRQLELPPNAGAERQFRLPGLPPNAGLHGDTPHVGSHYNVTLQDAVSQPLLIKDLVLWSSDLQPGGAVYEEVARFELKSSGY